MAIRPQDNYGLEDDFDEAVIGWGKNGEPIHGERLSRWAYDVVKRLWQERKDAYYSVHPPQREVEAKGAHQRAFALPRSESFGRFDLGYQEGE